jgi:hypothetical protein
MGLIGKVIEKSKIDNRFKSIIVYPMDDQKKETEKPKMKKDVHGQRDKSKNCTSPDISPFEQRAKSRLKLPSVISKCVKSTKKTITMTPCKPAKVKKVPNQ